MKFGKKPFDIFGQGLLPVTPRSISLGGHDLGSLTLVQGHHKTLKIEVAFLLGKSVLRLICNGQGEILKGGRILDQPLTCS